MDGLEDTNHIYRRGVDFEIVMKNMEAFSNAGGEGVIKFIEFDWNSHQMDDMIDLSERLNFQIRLKRSKRVERDIKAANDQVQKTSRKYIYCRYLESKDAYISAHLKVWPCCFIHFDEYANNEDFKTITDVYGDRFTD